MTVTLFIKCAICNESIYAKSLGIHLKKQHNNLNIKEYYDTYLKKCNEGICYCGKNTKFISTIRGYRKYCSDKCAVNDKEYIQKIHNTKLLKYGNPHYSNRNKAHETMLIKYKIEQYNNPEKTKETCLKKYGTLSYSGTKECQDKIKKTSMIKYGVESPNQDKNKFKKQIKRYTYDNISFDSSWELAYYIWLKDNNIQFEYQPDISFEYYYNNKKHIYHPDFKVDNDIIEIKGNHFIKNDTLICPFTKDLQINNIANAKKECMDKNNVIMYTFNEIKVYLKYVKEHYGKNFLKSLKN